MTILLAVRLFLWLLLSYPVLQLLEHALPGAPLLVPLYIGIISFIIYSSVSVNPKSLFDGPGLYDQHRLANLVIIGALFSLGVYALRRFTEIELAPDLHLSLLYWQLLFGFIAASMIPRLVIRNQGIVESLFSVKPYLSVVAVWIVSCGLMMFFNSSLVSLCVISASSAWLCSNQIRSMNS